MLEKHDLSTVPQSPPAQVEAPPAYESLSLANNNEGRIRLPDSPASPPPSFADTTSHPPAPLRRQAPPAKTHGRSLSSSSTTSVKAKRSWFSFSSSASPATSSRTPDEIRSTILNLLRDLVQEHSSGSPAASGILQSCADACATHNISLSSILQEPFMEGHTPLYWATVKRSRFPNQANATPQSADDIHLEAPTDIDILPALISHASPLTPETIKDLRLACLATSDQETFQKLYAMPQLSSTSGADQILLGGSISPDDVRVEIGPGTEGAFTVHFEVSQFHKRMMVKKEIVMEFVARNRFWRFAFFIAPDDVWHGPPPGSWCVSISLLESSPPTWFDARLLLDDPSNPDPSSPASILNLKSKQMMEAPRTDARATQIVVSLNDDTAFSSLQYSGNSYIGIDEKLKVRMEAKLVKSSVYGDV